jgi:hypothetical protein
VTKPVCDGKNSRLFDNKKKCDKALCLDGILIVFMVPVCHRDSLLLVGQFAALIECRRVQNDS